MKSYNIKIYQLCINIANCGDLIGALTTPDGDTLTPQVHKGNWLPSYEGSHIAYDGTLEFRLKNVVRFRTTFFSGIEIKQECGDKQGSPMVAQPTFITKPIKVGWNYRYPYSDDTAAPDGVKYTFSSNLDSSRNWEFGGIKKFFDKKLLDYSVWSSRVSPEMTSHIRFDFGRRVLFKEMGLFELYLLKDRPKNRLCMRCDGKRSVSKKNFYIWIHNTLCFSILLLKVGFQICNTENFDKFDE